MSQLAHIRQKIKAIQTTKKITHAVRLISMSFYNKLDRLNKPLKEFSALVQDSFMMMHAAAPQWSHPVFTPSPSAQYDLCIVVSTSKGLCGSLNSTLFKYLQQSLNTKRDRPVHFFAIGSKALNFLRGHDYVISHYYHEITSHNYATIADDITEKILSQNGVYASVTVFSSIAHSFFVQKPQRKALIPLTISTSELEQAATQEYIWEQDQQELADYAALLYFKSNLMSILFQAIRAEQAARFLAMENSTNNAEKILGKLTLQYNKLRQGSITKEISELSASFPVRSGQ